VERWRWWEGKRVAVIKNLLTFWMKWIKLMQRMKGGETMRRAYFHSLLVRLCKVMADGADELYKYGDRENAEMGELLLRYGKLLTDIGWVLTQGSKEVQEKVAEIVDEGVYKHDARMLGEDLVEWLSRKIGEVVDEARK
jgi:hypothetical protein